MIALILGGAPSVWDDLEEAEALLNSRTRLIVAANLAGIAYGGRLDAWASLHGDLLTGWLTQRLEAGGNTELRTFTTDEVPERWAGSSGLYATQAALFEMGACGAILCGVPMDSEAGHFTGRSPWESTASYRKAFEAALPLIGGRVRSMGGWTADVLGRPAKPWVEAICSARPLGASRSRQAREAAMHKISNVSKTSQRFNARRSNGDLFIARLAPGESGEFEADVNQAVFVRGHLKAAPRVQASEASAPVPTPKPAPPAGHKPLKPRPTEA